MRTQPLTPTEYQIIAKHTNYSLDEINSTIALGVEAYNRLMVVYEKAAEILPSEMFAEIPENLTSLNALIQKVNTFSFNIVVKIYGNKLSGDRAPVTTWMSVIKGMNSLTTKIEKELVKLQ